MEHQPPNIVSTTPDPPPFPAAPRTGDISPLEFILALLALVTIPALIYSFLFSLKCPPSNPFNRTRHRRGTTSTYNPDASFSGEIPRVQTTLDDKDKEAVREVKYKKEVHLKEVGTECPVCLSVFVDGDEVKILCPCKHSFHVTCIDPWLSSHSNCPVCRASVVVPSSAAAGNRPDTDRRGSRNGRDAADLQQGLPDASNLV